jgi:hypothetical protein
MTGNGIVGLMNREEWKVFTTRAQVKEQVEARRAIQRQMIGSLYPAILEDEINDLWNLHETLPRDS